MSTLPVLTVVADGLYWHPAGTDRRTSADMRIAEADCTLVHAKQLVVEGFLAARLEDESMPRRIGVMYESAGAPPDCWVDHLARVAVGISGVALDHLVLLTYDYSDHGASAVTGTGGALLGNSAYRRH